MPQPEKRPSEATHSEQIHLHQAHCRQLENQITELAAHIHADTSEKTFPRKRVFAGVGK